MINGGIMETRAQDISDFGEEKLLKIYPYVLEDAHSSKSFIKQNATSIAYITQNFETDQLQEDREGYFYFEMLADAEITTKLDIANHTSVYGQELKEEAEFNGISNYFPKSIEQQLNVNGNLLEPFVFVVGQPYDLDKYMKDDLPVFISTKIVEAKEADMDALDSEGQYSLDLVNIKVIESTLDGASVIFDTKRWVNHEGTIDYIQMNVENSMLFGGLKGKGVENKYQEIPIAATSNSIGTIQIDKALLDSLKVDYVSFQAYIKQYSDAISDFIYVDSGKRKIRMDHITESPDGSQYLIPFGNGMPIKKLKVFYTKSIGKVETDIDFKTNKAMVPFKLSPVDVNEKLTMYADWYDYDTILPGYIAKKFKADGGAGIEEAFKNDKGLVEHQDDLNLVEDMLAVSAAFASNWKDVPVYDSGAEIGKIQHDYLLGHTSHRASILATQSPINAINMLYENHKNKHPEFEENENRSKLVKGLIVALSRYIYSSLSIAGGANLFNAAYSPWYLETVGASGINYTKEVPATEAPVGTPTGAKTHVLTDGVKFRVKSVFLKDTYSNNLIEKGESSFTYPKQIKTSNQIMIQTDRKTQLPQIPDVLKPLDKYTFPGDIDPSKEDSLSYIWYVPFTTEAAFEKLLHLNETETTTVPAGTDIDVYPLSTSPGKILSTAQIEIWLKNWDVSKYGVAAIKTMPTISLIEQDGNGFYIYYEKDHHFQSADSFETDPELYFKWWLVKDNKKYLLNGQGGLIPRVSDRYHPVWWEPSASASTVPAIVMQELTAAIEKIYDYRPGAVKLKFKGRPSGHSGEIFEFTDILVHQEFSKGVITTSKEFIGEITEGERGIVYDKEHWDNMLNDIDDRPYDYNRIIFLIEDSESSISKIDEIVLTSIWSNYIELVQGNDTLRVPLLNSDDETIAKQRIIFT